MRPYAGDIGDNSFFIHDKALERRARVIDDYLQQETMERMDQLARALDLNPIAIAGTWCRELFHYVITSKSASNS